MPLSDEDSCTKESIKFNVGCNGILIDLLFSNETIIICVVIAMGVIQVSLKCCSKLRMMDQKIETEKE